MNSNRSKFLAYLDEMLTITVLLPFEYKGGQPSFTLLNEENEHFSNIEIISRITLDNTMKYLCRLEKEPVFGKQYWLMNECGEKTNLQIGAVIRTAAFDEAFYYDGPLGYFYSKEKTSFKIWAPTATRVKLQLLDSINSRPEVFDMKRGNKGVFELTIHRDLEYYQYSYLLCINLEWREATDPYANAVSMNGEYGCIIDISKTKTTKPPLPPLEQPTDAIIYETHIRDFTIHPNSGVTKKGRFIGVAQLNTKGKDGASTCLSYVKELGVTHIELLPINDFAGVDERGHTKEYNWGYNPLHFNAPEGSYSTNPEDPYARILELKEMIQAIHIEGIRVVLDVVYNHVYIRETSAFEKIVPGYYFRHDIYGMPSNGTGVGNDFASERLMARKFILDSVLFWLEEYQIDGFRFDLMGILDIDTMNRVRKTVDAVNPKVIIIGEGWDLFTPLPSHRKANIGNQAQLPGIAQFNDWFRDTIKGSTFNLHDKGFALGNSHYYEGAKQVLAGSIGLEHMGEGLFLSPCQTVNYVESHDNHTLWDKLLICYPDKTKNLLRRHHRLATVMVLLAQGIPFLHSGQEFFRTKKGIGNSYRSADEINYLDWDRKSQFIENVKYISGIIQIRKSHRAFRLPNAELIRKHLRFLPFNHNIIGYILENVREFGEWDRILVVFNPNESEYLVQLPKGEWDVLADDNKAGLSSVRLIIQQSLTLMPVSSYVLVSK